MTYRVIIEPSAEREIRSAMHWIIDHKSLAAAAKWYAGLIKKNGHTHNLSQTLPACGRERQIHGRNPRAALRKAAKHVPDHLHHPRRRGARALRPPQRAGRSRTLN